MIISASSTSSAHAATSPELRVRCNAPEGFAITCRALNVRLLIPHHATNVVAAMPESATSAEHLSTPITAVVRVPDAPLFHARL